MKREIEPDLLDDLKIIGERIREIRKDRTSINYKDFAEQLKKDGKNVSKNTLQRIETGNENYNLVSLLSLLKYFDIKVSDFFREAGL